MQLCRFNQGPFPGRRRTVLRPRYQIDVVSGMHSSSSRDDELAFSAPNSPVALLENALSGNSFEEASRDALPPPGESQSELSFAPASSSLSSSVVPLDAADSCEEVRRMLAKLCAGHIVDVTARQDKIEK